MNVLIICDASRIFFQLIMTINPFWKGLSLMIIDEARERKGVKITTKLSPKLLQAAS
jgi:hypothetical protein